MKVNIYENKIVKSNIVEKSNRLFLFNCKGEKIIKWD